MATRKKAAKKSRKKTAKKGARKTATKKTGAKKKTTKKTGAKKKVKLTSKSLGSKSRKNPKQDGKTPGDDRNVYGGNPVDDAFPRGVDGGDKTPN